MPFRSLAFGVPVALQGLVGTFCGCWTVGRTHSRGNANDQGHIDHVSFHSSCSQRLCWISSDGLLCGLITDTHPHTSWQLEYHCLDMFPSFLRLWECEGSEQWVTQISLTLVCHKSESWGSSDTFWSSSSPRQICAQFQNFTERMFPFLSPWVVRVPGYQLLVNSKCTECSFLQRISRL